MDLIKCAFVEGGKERKKAGGTESRHNSCILILFDIKILASQNDMI